MITPYISAKTWVVRCLFIGFWGVSLSCSANASQAIADQYPQSILYSKPIEFIPNVWSAIGATSPPTFENSGHNNNLSFIVTGEGVVVVNSGAAYSVASALHDEIKQITNQPVILVINENAQGHAMLGNGYWKALNVPIIAHVNAAKEFEHTAFDSLKFMQKYNQEKSKLTTVQGPSETFEKEKVLTLGDFKIRILWLGSAHSPGDLVVFLENRKLVISGDMAFHERLLPVMDATETGKWLESWEKFEALKAVYVIPGHGHPTNMDQVRRYTKDYIAFLRLEVESILDAGGDLQDAYNIDQSQYSHLDTFEELAAKNAGRVFTQMEFE